MLISFPRQQVLSSLLLPGAKPGGVDGCSPYFSFGHQAPTFILELLNRIFTCNMRIWQFPCIVILSTAKLPDIDQSTHDLYQTEKSFLNRVLHWPLPNEISVVVQVDLQCCKGYCNGEGECSTHHQRSYAQKKNNTADTSQLYPNTF